MALDFPASPTVGQKYPASPVAGVPTYTWTGTLWTTQGTGAVAGKLAVYSDGSVPMTAQLTLQAGTDPTAVDHAARKAYVDAQIAALSALCLKVAGGQTTTGGFKVTPYSQAAGSFTVNPLNGNYQYTTNNGAFTITAPTGDCAVDILVTNGAAAGGITFTGFTVGSNIGDALTTTNGHRFIISVRRINAVATYIIKALQ
jgi:hypothetical protein